MYEIRLKMNKRKHQAEKWDIDLLRYVLLQKHI